MCEKCDRTSADLAPTLVESVRKGMELVSVKTFGRPLSPPPDQMLLLLVQMVVHQAEAMGEEPGPVLLRAGGAVLAEVCVSRALAVNHSAAPTTH